MVQDGRTRQQRAVATRAVIVEAAAAEFDEHGYLGTSMDAVALRAGLTKGALYFHFGSKADLAGAVIARQHEVSRAYTTAAAARGTTPLEVVLCLCEGFASQLVHEVVVSAGVRLSTDTNAREVERRDPYTDWMAVMTDLVRQGIDAGEVDPRWDPELVGRVIVPAYTGTQTVSDVLHDRSDLHERLRELWTVLLSAIVTERTRPEIPRLVALIAPQG